MCWKKHELILVGQPKMKKICLSCEDLKECVLVYTRGEAICIVCTYVVDNYRPVIAGC